MKAKKLRVGQTIRYRDELWRVLSIQHIAPGNWRAFVQTKLRSVFSGNQTEQRFSSDDEIERAVLDHRTVQFLYAADEMLHFMDDETYDQFQISSDGLGDAVRFLTPNMKVEAEMYEGAPIGFELPTTVTLRVVQTDPYLKSATVTNSYKAAKVESGATVQVPGFVSEGDLVEVDPSTGEYVGRGKE